jgi:hypothetical protein
MPKVAKPRAAGRLVAERGIGTQAGQASNAHNCLSDKRLTCGSALKTWCLSTAPFWFVRWMFTAEKTQ